MRCAKLINRIESYLGGTLTLKEKGAFDKHIESCEACKSELERCTAENKNYRQALSSQRLVGTVRNIVLSRLKHAYTTVREHVEAQPEKVLWIAPVAAVAQFLMAFWLSGILFLGSASEKKMEVFCAPEGKIVSVEWVRGFSRHRYFSVKERNVAPGTGVAEKDTKVD